MAENKGRSKTGAAEKRMDFGGGGGGVAAEAANSSEVGGKEGKRVE